MFHAVARLLGPPVWARGGVPPHMKDEQLDVRVLLPIFDVGLIVLGFYGAHNTVPALDEVYDPYIVDAFAYALSAVAAIDLFAVSFPRLEWIELFAKLALIGTLAVYPAILLWTALFDGIEGRFFAGIGLGLLGLIPLRRVLQLIMRIWRHRTGTEPTGPLSVVGHG